MGRPRSSTGEAQRAPSTTASLPDRDSTLGKTSHEAGMKRSAGTSSIADGDARDIQVGTATIVSQATEGSVLETLRAWPFAVVWSLVFSFPMIMVAYSPTWISQLYALPAFVMDFGEYYEGELIIPAKWQTALSASAIIGQIIGAIFIATPMDKFGRKLTFSACIVAAAAFTFIQFFAKNLSTTLAGALLLGICLGCFGVLSLTYAVEVAPFKLRGLLIASVSLAIVLGGVVGIGVAAGVAARLDHWGYSIGYAIQWVWPALIIPALPFAPESPVWLVRVGRVEEAERALRKMAIKGVDVRPTLALITETDRQEREMEMSSTYRECFTGSNLRRTIIAIVSYSAVVTTGTFIMGWSAYTLSLAGLDYGPAFDMSVGISVAGFLGSLVGLVLIATFRRRKLGLCGLAVGAVLLLCVGFINLAPNYHTNPSVVWAQAAIMLLWNFTYGATISPVLTTVMSEVSSDRLRSKTIAVASMVQFLLGLIITIVFPYLVNIAQANLEGRTGFIFGGIQILYALWAFFQLPETNIPVEELDVLFDRKIKARHFEQHALADLETT